VLVDGAFPISMLAEADKEQARRTFRRLAPLMRVMAVFNRSARMSGSEAADLNIELDDLAASLTYDYDIIHCPIEFIVGSKPHMGATDEQCRTMRASITALVEQHGNISLFATLPASHDQAPRHRRDGNRPGLRRAHPDGAARWSDRVAAPDSYSTGGVDRKPPSERRGVRHRLSPTKRSYSPRQPAHDRHATRRVAGLWGRANRDARFPVNWAVCRPAPRPAGRRPQG
jgi:hypothetical protein